MQIGPVVGRSKHTHTRNLVSVAGAPEPRGQQGADAPAALVVRGRRGAEKCPFRQDNS